MRQLVQTERNTSHSHSSFMAVALHFKKQYLGFTERSFFNSLTSYQHSKTSLKSCQNLRLFFRRQHYSGGLPEESRQWETSQLAHDFQFALGEVLKEERPVYLYVDALNECGEDDARHLVETFERMTRIFRGKSLHICFSSRHYPLLMLSDVDQICVEDHNQGDIKEYVRPLIRPFLARRFGIQ